MMETTCLPDSRRGMGMDGPESGLGYGKPTELILDSKGKSTGNQRVSHSKLAFPVDFP